MSSFVHHFKAICNCSYCLETLNSGQDWRFFFAVWPWNLTDDIEKQYGTSPILCQVYASFQNHWWIQTGVTVQKLSIRVKIGDVFCRVTLKFDGWPWKTIEHIYKLCQVLCIIKTHWWIQTGVQYSPETLNLGQNWRCFFLSRVTFKFDGWPWKTIWHLFYTMSSSMHDLKTIGEFKLELQSRNSQFGSKLIFFIPCDLEIWQMTLKNKMAPLHTMSRFMHNFKTIGEFKLELQSRNSQFGSKLIFFIPCDLEIWRMTSKNNMAPLLYFVKLNASFQTIGGFKLELQSRNSQFGSKLAIFFWPRVEIWRMTLKNNITHIWNYVKLYA